MIGGQSSCAIHSGSPPGFMASGETRSPSRTSRTVRREQPRDRAMSCRLWPSASSRRISAYRGTVILLNAILSFPSWLPTKLQRQTKVPAAYKSNKPQRLTDQNDQSPPYEPTRAPIVVRPLSQSPRKALCFLLFSASEDHSIASARRVKPRSAGGPQLRKSGGTELRKSSGTHPRKSDGSDQRKFCKQGIARESEGRSRLSLLRPVRQDQ